MSVEITPALVGERVRVTYTQRYTSGRSETRVETGRLLRITPAGGIEIRLPSMNLPGLGASPTSLVIPGAAITKVEQVR